VRRILARAGTARAVTSLDRQDLRGWHYVLTGGVLATLSPYGFGAGMTGRWAYLSDSADGCAAVLDEGDGSAPPDPDEGLRRFVEAVTAPGTRDGGWLSGIREYIPDAGPVPSSRFL